VRAEGKEFLEERTPGWERAWWTQVAERSPVCMNRVSKGQILEGWERSGQVGLSDWVHKIGFSLFFETGPQGWPWTHAPPASVSWLLILSVYTTRLDYLLLLQKVSTSFSNNLDSLARTLLAKSMEAH
jgi:hypothetical protein